MTKIDRNLNLVIPILGDPITVKDSQSGEDVIRENIVAWVHSTPVSSQIWDTYFLDISGAFVELYKRNLNWALGPRVAMKMLEKVAKEAGTWDDAEGRAGVNSGLVGEIKRSTHVAAPGPQGWEVLPYYQAVERNIISADDAREVENQIAFFTLAWWVHTKNEREAVIREAARFSGSQVTSLNITEFVASLKTSTPVASTGEKEAPSLIPR